MDAIDLEERLENFDHRVRLHGLDSARETLEATRGPEDAAVIYAEYVARIGQVREAGTALWDSDDEDSSLGWYLPPPLHRAPRWSYARGQLGLDEASLEKTDAVANEILARLRDPNASNRATRALVVGHVQSGKTTNFLSVAAKAADAGYNLVIVLAGIHNALRRQTQDRAVRTLVHKRDLWWLGTAVGDFRSDGNPLSTHLSGGGKRGLLVVKKNKAVLKRLADWLEESNDAARRDFKILVIDDEADQAGLDVAPGTVRQGIHAQLMRILNLQPENRKEGEDEYCCAYLAYTATPYANILTSQEEDGLYPRNFIYPLDQPPEYVGPQELFGANQVGNPVKVMSHDSTSDLDQGLEDAVRWFVLATAARAAIEGSVDKFHSSMLVHVSGSTEEQIAYRPRVEAILLKIRDEFERNPDAMRDRYETGLLEVPAQQAGPKGSEETSADWASIQSHIAPVLRRLIHREASTDPYEEDGRMQQAKSGVIVDNSKVDWIDRLAYSDIKAKPPEPSVTVIAIGGNTLSRGLTLEGLVCSYFARPSRTYDSLMQMGRWFGYRRGYRHLTRIWTTSELLHWFIDLARVETELRDELAWMIKEGLSPAQYGPRIRTSSYLNITRPSVQKSVDRHVSFSDRVIDPSMLNVSVAAMKSNQKLCRELAKKMDHPIEGAKGPSPLFSNVPHEVVREFLHEFQHHESDIRIDMPGILRYLDQVVANSGKGEAQTWNVMFKSNSQKGTDPFNFEGNVGSVQTIVRAKAAGLPDAHIGGLVDSSDHRSDFGHEPASAKYRDDNEPPLLMVYAIDSKSEPRGNRVELGLDDNPLSIAIALPRNEKYVEYVQPALRAEALVHLDDNVDLGDFESE